MRLNWDKEGTPHLLPETGVKRMALSVVACMAAMPRPADVAIFQYSANTVTLALKIFFVGGYQIYQMLDVSRTCVHD